jgi:ankyrin repeat protein
VQAALAFYSALEDTTLMLQAWEGLNPETGFVVLKPQLDLAARNGHGEIVGLLLRRGINLDDSTVLAAFDAEPLSPGRSIPGTSLCSVHRSPQVGHKRPMRSSVTVLKYAVIHKRMELAQWMMDMGADIEHR